MAIEVKRAAHPHIFLFFLAQTLQVQQTLKLLERRRMDGKLRYISIVTFTKWANFNRKINIFNGFILKIIKNSE